MGTEIKRCLIVSGAPEADIAYIKPLLPGTFVVAADSGYPKCRCLGAEPDIVVRDFDSSPVPEHPRD
jgi:Thiamine pyrophosphokinase